MAEPRGEVPRATRMRGLAETIVQAREMARRSGPVSEKGLTKDAEVLARLVLEGPGFDPTDPESLAQAMAAYIAGDGPPLEELVGRARTIAQEDAGAEVSEPRKGEPAVCPVHGERTQDGWGSGGGSPQFNAIVDRTPNGIPILCGEKVTAVGHQHWDGSWHDAETKLS